MTTSFQDQGQLNAFSADILEMMPESVLISDQQGIIHYVNARTEQLFGYSRQQLLNQSTDLLLPPRFRKTHRAHRQKYLSRTRPRPIGHGLELFGLHRNGHEFPIEMNISVMKKTEQRFIISTIRDILARKYLENALLYHDHLTDLPNRFAFERALSIFYSAGKRYQRMSALFFIDVDKFKKINDTYGHTVGDQVLKIVAHRLKVNLRHEDFLARFGGDEFVIVLNQINDLYAATIAAQRLCDAFHEPCQLSEYQLSVHISIGLVCFPDHILLEDVVHRADEAMYQAKKKKGNRWVQAQ